MPQSKKDYNAKSRARYKERIGRLAISLGKDPRVCERCGKTTGRKGVLHWHHRNPATKSFELGNQSKHTDQDLLDELAKCERVCRSCHYYHHSMGGQGSVSRTGGATTYVLQMTYPTKELADEALAMLAAFKGLQE